MLTALFISRLQFAFTISMHILFPAFSIGLATFLTVMEGAWLFTKNTLYRNICKFWVKVFALTFGMGVVSGIVMEFQLGTNWSLMSQMIGGVLGALFTYEVLTAFFIEAGFLGVMLFGWNKVGPKLHYCSTLLVTFGVTLSAFWILSANSWMQTPSGVNFVNHHFVITSFKEVIFNPSVFPRYIHMLLAAYITTLFAIAGVSSFYLLRQQHVDFSKTCLSFSMWALIILIPLQIFMGDSVGLIIHQYQPIKTAAMEGLWHSTNGASLLLFAWPDMAKQTNFLSVAIPHLASVINTHQWNGFLQGLTSVSPADQPFVPFVFFSFRIMVGLGILMFLIAFVGLCLRVRKKIFTNIWFLRTCQWCAPIGFIALWAGWITAETGRQPFIVYHYLRTTDGVSPISLHDILISFILIVVVYGIIFGVFYFRYLGKVIEHGPEQNDQIEVNPFMYMNDSNTADKRVQKIGDQ
jgi:cytochrome d ubiquinol oxidase subunit I